MTDTNSSQDERKARARQKVERFVGRFGEPYRLLACHAALPLVLTPELVNYLRTEFLLDKVNWVAEADLLLSDLCRETGYETYIIDGDVREFLLDQMRNSEQMGTRRMQDVARRVFNYVNYLARTDLLIRPEDLQSQRLAAMVCIDEQRARAVRELVEALEGSHVAPQTYAPNTVTNWAELVRLTHLIKMFREELGDEYAALVEYARNAGLVAAVRSGELEKSRIPPDQLKRDYQVLGVNLKRLDWLLEQVEQEKKRPVATPRELTTGEVLRGRIDRVTPLFNVIVDIGDDTKGIALPSGIPSRLKDFVRTDDFDWVVIWPRSNDGYVVLSLISANRPNNWDDVERAHASGENVIGRVTKLARDGLWLALGEVEAFLPRDEFDANPREFPGREIVVRITEFSRHSRVRLSRKIVTEEERSRREEELLSLEPRLISTGLVKHITDYGAFVDLGGMDGLLHKTEMSWRDKDQPKDLFKVGDLIDVKVLNVDRERKRISLGYKELMPNPWDTVKDRYNTGETVTGRVVSVYDYGAFVEIEPGVVGRLRASEISRTEKVSDATKFLGTGQEIEAIIISIDTGQHHIDLSLKQLPSPPKPIAEPFKLTDFSFQTVTLDERGEVIKRETRQARQFIEELAPGVTLEMVEIPGGTFMMGAPESEENIFDRERPQHEVTVSPFYIGKYTITQEQWRVIAEDKSLKVERDLKPAPSRFKGKDRPVERVSWHDAVEYCARLAKKTGRAYRLPTEAEWEYACRAGTTTPFAFGKTITHEIVNYWSEVPYAEAPKNKQRGETVPVGSLGVANAFGLFDMHGNVWEWCEDTWHKNYMGAPRDGSAWLSGGDSSICVLRGGSHGDNARYCRSAYRNVLDARSITVNVGIRVVVSARSS